MAAVSALVPTRHRRKAILILSIAFYVLANIKTPVSILFLAVSAAFSYCASYAVYISRKRSKRRMLFFCVGINVLMLVVLRYLGVRLEAYDVTFLPLGASIYLLLSVSMLIDISRSDAEPPKSFADAALYICFFPILIAGPIVKYKDFVRLTSEDEIKPSMTGMADGLLLFARGFIKRIGISAILADAYDEISTAVTSANSLQLPVGVFLVLLMLTNVYFAFSGYSDMGRGIARIMGIRLETDFYYPFAACSPTEYLKRFFGSLYFFIEDYFAEPIERAARAGVKKRGLRCGLRVVYFIVGMLMAAMSALWFKASLPMLLAFLPLMFWVACGRAYGNGTERPSPMRRNLMTRSIGRGATLVLVSAFWVQVKLRSVDQFMEYIASLTSIGSYQSYRIYMVIFNREYAWVVVCALMLTLPAIFDRCAPRLSRGRVGSIMRYIYAAGIAAVFVFSVFVIMPQYPEYAEFPFKYITL